MNKFFIIILLLTGFISANNHQSYSHVYPSSHLPRAIRKATQLQKGPEHLINHNTFNPSTVFVQSSQAFGKHIIPLLPDPIEEQERRRSLTTRRDRWKAAGICAQAIGSCLLTLRPRRPIVGGFALAAGIAASYKGTRIGKPVTDWYARNTPVNVDSSDYLKISKAYYQGTNAYAPVFWCHPHTDWQTLVGPRSENIKNVIEVRPAAEENQGFPLLSFGHNLHTACYPPKPPQDLIDRIYNALH